MWEIAANLRQSEESFRITSNALNMYYFDNSGPIIRLISCKLEAIGILTSYIKQLVQCFCWKSVC